MLLAVLETCGTLHSAWSHCSYCSYRVWTFSLYSLLSCWNLFSLDAGMPASPLVTPSLGSLTLIIRSVGWAHPPVLTSRASSTAPSRLLPAPRLNTRASPAPRSSVPASPAVHLSSLTSSLAPSVNPQ
ncbi:uncharacterized protein LOC123963240 isoform X2 [Micropterus dolomieu]|uniref:uncharacterized protein LOC123963240 isoform X2 n=1 Tax=Micropterus dolomieu TaxID=147949 RepID=UPI001E8E8D14|nr:uncharacterized protein LOC123963240 isoform X2 [Micropterus dolomieu]